MVAMRQDGLEPSVSAWKAEVFASYTTVARVEQDGFEPPSTRSSTKCLYPDSATAPHVRITGWSRFEVCFTGFTATPESETTDSNRQHSGLQPDSTSKWTDSDEKRNPKNDCAVSPSGVRVAVCRYIFSSSELCEVVMNRFTDARVTS